MNIHLIANGNKLPNLALMRLSTYHKSKGDSITLTEKRKSPLRNIDKGYVSSPFSFNTQELTDMLETFPYPVERGGSGFSLVNLPEEVEKCEPDYSIYPDVDYAIGYISRGCVRKCPWCIVPEKEGLIRYVQSAESIVGNRKRVRFLDNNFLALPKEVIYENCEWLEKNKIEVTFTQGLDIRLVTPEIANRLGKLRWKNRMITIALDSEENIPQFTRGVFYLKEAGFIYRDIQVYCLIGFSGLESDLKRLWFLHNERLQLFPMKYKDINGNEPRKGWDEKLYKKYARLFMRMPNFGKVWEEFKLEVGGG